MQPEQPPRKQDVHVACKVGNKTRFTLGQITGLARLLEPAGWAALAGLGALGWTGLSGVVLGKKEKTERKRQPSGLDLSFLLFLQILYYFQNLFHNRFLV